MTSVPDLLQPDGLSRACSPLVGAGQWGLCFGVVHEPQQTCGPTAGVPGALQHSE